LFGKPTNKFQGEAAEAVGLNELIEVHIKKLS
jgi:hypothetical protein